MLRILKTLLLWLLLAALPIQGIAAAAMMSCRTMEHSGTTAHAKHHAMMSAAIPATMHAHHHHAADNVPAAHAGSAHSDADHQSHGKHDGSTSCSACSACCIGTAVLPSTYDWTVAHGNSEQVVVHPAPLLTGHIPDGIERPPRAVSA